MADELFELEKCEPNDQVHFPPGLGLADLGQPEDENTVLGVLEGEAFFGVVIEDVRDVEEAELLLLVFVHLDGVAQLPSVKWANTRHPFRQPASN